jgi:hypothetical protein
MDTKRTPADAGSVNPEDQRLAELAAAVDCMTEEEFRLLADITEGTSESWRKRGKGPAYVLIGNRYLYPRAAVREFVQRQVRQPRQQAARGCL